MSLAELSDFFQEEEVMSFLAPEGNFMTNSAKLDSSNILRMLLFGLKQDVDPFDVFTRG